MYVCMYVHHVLILTVFQSDSEHWDCTARVHPELESLYKEYKGTLKRMQFTHVTRYAKWSCTCIHIVQL